MIRRFMVFTAAALLVLAAGCSTDTELGGVKIPNSRPDTRVVGQPPTLLEAGFAVSFNWTGSDPDGRVVGYQWKISNNGIDGITPRDTLTYDPLTGAELHPWHYTTATDSTFLVMADQADFPPDGGNNPRSFRTHSLFIRSVDDQGAVDPVPAFISFTSTTIVPSVRVVYPNLNSQGAQNVPSTVNVGWIGRDDDFELKVPTKIRFLWKPAIDANGDPIRVRYEYDQHYSEILNFDDPEWTDWVPYASQQVDRQVGFRGQEEGKYYLFAVQAEDTAGAVSVGFGYQQEVGHFHVLNNVFSPSVTVNEPFLGTFTGAEKSDEIAGGQPLNFSWTASASAYNGKIVSYRHGWDLVSVDDPDDPGWAVPPGLSKQNKFAVETSFPEGVHTLTIKVVDDSGQVKIINWKLRVIPFVDPAFQLPLMVLDQTVDHFVQNWPDQGGQPRNDETFRNPWWHFLADGAGGVADINWERDWHDHFEDVTFSDAVKYKSILCYAQANGTASQQVFNHFRPVNGVDQFVWFTPYQQRGGNLFLVGGSSMESFLEPLGNYMVPIIFNTRETTFVLDGQSYVVGFGTIKRPDGTEVQRGPLQYPYATAGIAALDWTAVASKTIYGRSRPVRFDRTAACVGIKGITLDDDFRNNHLIGPGVIADTMYTDKVIDWHDEYAAANGGIPLFTNDFPFNNDEFVDANISKRTTQIIPQECEGNPFTGMCVEPMFRGIARFDWLREIHYAEGDTLWPNSIYSAFQLDDGCGEMALTSYQGKLRSSARTNGKVFGYMSYKTVTDKPSQKADVYWGFDPYRFNSEKSRKAIRWVLQYFGLQINQ